MTAFYEKIIHKELDFPITFEVQHLTPLNNKIAIHWHESIELIQVVEGVVEVMIGSEVILANSGDTIIINSNILHSFFVLSQKCTYNYLKIDTSFFKNFDIDIESLDFQILLKNDTLNSLFEDIRLEFLNQYTYFKVKIKTYILNLIIYLIRNHLKTEKKLNENEYAEYVNITKEILSYININYQSSISLDKLSKEIGVSKYHLCRIFKTVTSHTIMEHTNFIRCENARSLLHTGKYTISQASQICGFNSPSYFTKTYKKLMGTSPSKL